jgi:hypothetical protein
MAQFWASAARLSLLPRRIGSGWRNPENSLFIAGFNIR